MSAYQDALMRLRTAGKPNYGAPAYSRWVNRPLGRRLAALSYVRGLSPNQVTALSAASSLVGVLMIGLLPPTWLSGVAITLALLLGYALDSADGQLARLQGGGSPSGEWLDHMVDTVKVVLVHGAVLVAWLRHEQPFEWWMALLPIGYILASTTAFFGWQLAELLQQRGGATPPRAVGAPVVRSLLRSPSDWGVFCLLFLVWPTSVFMIGYGLLAVANLLIVALALPVWFRQAGRSAR